MHEPDDRICFGIQAYNEPELCERLIRILCQDDDAVILHIDKKAKDFRSDILGRTKDVKNLHVIPIEESVLVNWSGFSQVKATLLLLEHYSKLPSRFKWFSFHSGQDYPIKPVSRYRAFLSEQAPNMLIEVDSNPMLWRCQLYNFFRENPYNRTLWLTALDNLLRKIQKPFIQRNKGIDFKRGSSWFTASRESCIKLLDGSSKDWQKIWKYTATPDEHYFQTLAHVMGIPVITDNYRHIVWKGNASSPETLNEEHLDALLDSKAFFARKFTCRSRRIMDLLDANFSKNYASGHSSSVAIPVPA